MIARLEGYLRENLLGRSLPLVIVHGDFSPRQIIFSHDNDAVVLDWEHGYLHGMPAIDLFHFSTRCNEKLRHGDDPTGFATLAAAEMETDVNRYFRFLDIDRALYRPLCLLAYFHFLKLRAHPVHTLQPQRRERYLLRPLHAWVMLLGLT